MRNKTPKIQSALKTFELLESLCENVGHSSIASIAEKHKIPLASAYRQVATLEEAGLIVRTGTGKFVPSYKIFRMANRNNWDRATAAIAEPILRNHIRKLGVIAQLGTLDDDMVTYRLKVGSGADNFFTVVGSQLEAYCSALGKLLLAIRASLLMREMA